MPLQNPELWHALAALGGATGGPGSPAQALGQQGMQQAQAWALQEELDRQRDAERRARRQQVLGTIGGTLLGAAGGPVGGAIGGALGGTAATAAGTVAGQAVGGGLGQAAGALTGGPMSPSQAFIGGALQHGGQAAIQQAPAMMQQGGQQQYIGMQGQQPHGQVTGPQGTVGSGQQTVMPAPQRQRQAQPQQQDIGMQVRDAVMQALPQALAGAGVGQPMQPMGGMQQQAASPFGPAQALGMAADVPAAHVQPRISPILGPEQQQLVTQMPEARAQAQRAEQAQAQQAAIAQQQAMAEEQRAAREHDLEQRRIEHEMALDRDRFSLDVTKAMQAAMEAGQPEVREIRTGVEDGRVVSRQMRFYPDGRVEPVEELDPVPTEPEPVSPEAQHRMDLQLRQAQPPAAAARDRAAAQASLARAQQITQGQLGDQTGWKAETKRVVDHLHDTTVGTINPTGIPDQDLRLYAAEFNRLRYGMQDYKQAGVLGDEVLVPPPVIFSNRTFVDEEGNIIQRPGLYEASPDTGRIRQDRPIETIRPEQIGDRGETVVVRIEEDGTYQEIERKAGPPGTDDRAWHERLLGR